MSVCYILVYGMRTGKEMREQRGIAVQVRGLVQGVGFRPTVWRLARKLQLVGDVLNDCQGVTIRIWGNSENLEKFLLRLHSDSPPLARIDSLDTQPLDEPAPGDGFRILPSREGEVHTGVVPDAAICPDCRAEVLDPKNRRYRYPFTNCTHCGPRLSIVRAIPYDRANTSMDRFTMCPACEREYQDPADRRFHAQPNACAVCGPRLWLEGCDGVELETTAEEDAVHMAARLILQGKIVAIKGIGGFHLACDATSEPVVRRLRERKGRYHKPFALMAGDEDMVLEYCRLGDLERALLQSPAAPIVLLESRGGERLAPSVAPGQRTLGFMLPYTPLHLLLLEHMPVPIVLTSGNLSEEPQVTGNPEARSRLAPIADYLLMHDRHIINRVDDSVVRIMGDEARLLRRGRGYSPTTLPLSPAPGGNPSVTALGGELKNTFCLLKDGQAVLSQHLGDLEDAETYKEYKAAQGLYSRLFRHRAGTVAVDMHPGYRSTRYGRELVEKSGMALEQVQHHHAHIAACLAENRWGSADGPVLGIALDGLGYGPDGTLWGGEFLLADYSGYERLGRLRSFPLPGGSQVMREPWRSCYAQLSECLGGDWLEQWDSLELVRYLRTRPLELLDRMIAGGINSPMSSSAGRLFDAVAAVLDICRERSHYEGQAAIELEASVPAGLIGSVEPYPFAVGGAADMAVLDPAPMWYALLDDLKRKREREAIAAAFHAGFADGVVGLAIRLCRDRGLSVVALSGGVFQNRLLFERVLEGMKHSGIEVLTNRLLPSNDGGIALGQAVVAAARRIRHKP